MKKVSKDLSIKEIVKDLIIPLSTSFFSTHMPRDKKFYKDLEKYKDFI
tara:strand:- start:135 stop:278 length:144 start_codon:yes stop_codon:yes gene_type:complete